MPIGVYSGLGLTGASVRDAILSANAQSDAVLALHKRLETPIMLTAMDLSAEAEAFGCAVRLSDNEIPTVIGRLVTGYSEIDLLPEPVPGDARTKVHLDTARMLSHTVNGVPVLGSMIGPFSLAGRIFGVSEILEATLSEPDLVEALLVRCTRFLIKYALAFKETGASGVIMAEPAAGLLSPRGLARFSSTYIRQIVSTVQDESFTLVLHNCGAKLVHLPRILESGAEIYHFGAPMDLPAALAQVSGNAVLCGNLDPTAVFFSSRPDEVCQYTRALLEAAAPFPGFIPSSGCDLPPGTPLANLEAFFNTVKSIS